MPVTNFAFAGGATGIAGYGDRWQVQFGGTWVHEDKWGIVVAASGTNFDLGSINFFSSSLFLTFCATIKNRVFLAAGPQFNFSDNNEPTGWNQQNPGAGEIPYMSYFGSLDSVVSFGQLQGRLVVFGRRSIQIWSTDADPAQFALVQSMENIGTIAPFSVQQLGDYDLLFLDDTGVRSVRTREVTLNAFVDDVGTPIDSLVKGQAVTTACSIVEPATKNFWLYLNGKIYVLSRHPASKISAWSTYLPVAGGVTFVPLKFIIYNGQVSCRTTDRRLVRYGPVYDGTVLTVQTPWLDHKHPSTQKAAQSIDLAWSGGWAAQASMDPISQTFEPFASVTAPTGDMSKDSTFDNGFYAFNVLGTHVSFKLTTLPTWLQAARLGAITFKYQRGKTQ